MRTAVLVAGLALSASVASSGTAQPSLSRYAELQAKRQASPTLQPEQLYQGWRSRRVIGLKVVKEPNQVIGTCRDLIIDQDGRIAALVVEGGGLVGVPESVYRIPWDRVTWTGHGDRVLTDAFENGSGPKYGVFPGTEGIATLPREFRISEVLGDYARLRTGRGFGVVTDAVFSRDSRLIAILVSRDATSGGGTLAYPYPGRTGRWDPALGYYGLPFVTPEHAAKAGVRVDPERFRSAES